MAELIHPMAADLKQAVADARALAEREAQRLSRGKGVLRSRGAWVIVATRGECLVVDGAMPFKGTQKQLDALLKEYASNPAVTGIHIEGGFDWATSVRDMAECGPDEPWISEWSVPIWVRDKE